MKNLCTLKDAVSPWLQTTFPNIKKYIEYGNRSQIKKGTILISPGERSNYLYYILRGNLKTCMVSYDGQEKIFAILGSNTLVYEGTLLNNNISSVLVTALDNCEVVSFNEEQLQSILSNDPEATLDLLNYLHLKYKMLVSLHQGLLFCSPPQRLCRLLCILADNFGERLKNNVIIHLRLTQNQLAELLGVSRVTISHILKEMRQQEILEIKNRKIIFNEKICTYCQKY
ncbi:MAG: family transcriptional regulator, cyclic receptor protein [Clostridia bacterium]|jgi:CRP/FNR family transcriptional regulator|nr:family transcriptional regulator, cyclic receptor protein [Clostridia bacterium]MDN5321821.1 family transcriptional regulator, cyclic receptor protein [Clostridia bacterium]